jgi:hypothetical protein
MMLFIRSTSPIILTYYQVVSHVQQPGKDQISDPFVLGHNLTHKQIKTNNDYQEEANGKNAHP